MRVSKTVTFDMAHRITNHKGKCQNLHGHTYRIEVVLEGGLVNQKDASDLGMVMDFGMLKKIVDDSIVNKYDHSTMIWSDDKLLIPMFKKLAKKGMNVHFVDFPTTAENMSIYFFYEIAHRLPQGVKLVEVNVWETPNAYATYGGPADVI